MGVAGSSLGDADETDDFDYGILADEGGYLDAFGIQFADIEGDFGTTRRHLMLVSVGLRRARNTRTLCHSRLRQ